MSRRETGEERPSKNFTPLPSGTVTFLFSDIEGSTRRWERHHEAMEAAVSRHDALLRAAIEERGGYIFKTAGDAFCAAFETAQNALAAAVDAQHALSEQDFSAVDGLRVRMALHTGSAEERDADYFGPAVNRIARLVSLGHGGQVLVSAGTYELLQHGALHDTSFTDLGLHRLKDLAQPEHVWQVNIKGALGEFPSLRSLDALPNNLPIQVTTFCGRAKDVEDLKSHLAEHRLVTLFGAGGVGKTRLAAQVGADLLDHFPDGVWIADLAPITDAELVPSVVAQALDVGKAQGRLDDNSIARSLKNKRLLLVLDNCEHVLEAAARLGDVIHRNCPDIRVLATSRQALGVSGEKVLRLASLAVPDKHASLTSANALQFGAVALFMDRASLVDQSFAVNDDNAPIVSDICRRLDGIPLAIELAAARVKVLSVSNLAKRLSERFKILTGGSRTALPRQKTLTALIDWSYDMLLPAERALFDRLAIFAGTITLDAATLVCAGDGIDEEDILDLICSLVDKSLLHADTKGNLERYRMLESTRQYALEKLTASGEQARFAHRHAEYFRSIAQKAQANFGAMPLSEWLMALYPEVDNFRATLEWALGKGHDAVLGGAVASALEMFWWHGGVEAEGRYWLEVALRQIDAGEQPDAVAQLRRSMALLTSRMLFS